MNNTDNISKDPLEDLGYIYKYDNGKIKYLRSLDGFGESVWVDDLSYAKRYLQEDLIVHDLCMLQYICTNENIQCSMPYSV